MAVTLSLSKREPNYANFRNEVLVSCPGNNLTKYPAVFKFKHAFETS